MAVDVGDVPRRKTKTLWEEVAIVKPMGYFYMKSLNSVYGETKCPHHPRPPTASLNYSSSPN